MTRALRLTIAGMTLVPVIAACGDTWGATAGERVDGSGTVITETRPVADFDEVVVFGSGDVLVDVTGTESLQLETDDNLLPLITTDVVDGRLELSVEPNTSLRPTAGITFTIAATELTAITILGTADIEVTGIDSSEFDVTINGSGDVTPQGSTQRLDVTVNGSGNFMGGELVASMGKTTINGRGSIVINATDELTARIAGSGNIRYLGEPVVDAAVTGSGGVSPA